MNIMAIPSLMVLVIVSGSALLMVNGQDTTFDVNVALGKPARQSSTYRGQARWGDTDNVVYDASLAVDGKEDTNFRRDSCSHTDAGHRNAWWEVDLESLYSITRIKIYQRWDAFTDRNVGSTVSRKLENDSYEVLTTLDSSHVFTFNADSSNIFKGIRVDHSGGNDVYICLCEVEVFVVNVARSKPTSQSSTYFGENYGEHGLYNASLAVDGNIDTDFHQHSCSHTDSSQREWWKVDLQGLYAVTGIRIYQRLKGNDDWLSGYKLLGRSNSGTYEIINTPPYKTGLILISVSPAKAFDEIMIQLNGTGHGICLCEVQVIATITCSMPSLDPTMGTYACTERLAGACAYKSMLTIQCNTGYKLSGYKSSQCLGTDNWSRNMGVCVAITCSMPSLDPTMGTYSYTERVAGACAYKSMLTIQCNTGYKLSGYKSSQCIGTDNWSRNMGVCVTITCSMPPLNQAMGTYECNERVAGACAYNSILTIQCNRGYKLSGYNSSQCIGTDLWNRSIGVCDAIPCHIPDIDSKKGIYELHPVHAGNMSYTSYLTIKCKEGYRLNGSDIIRCTSTGEWDTSIGQCTAIQCSVPFVLPNNSIYLYEEGIEGNLTFNSTISFRCQEGYKVYGTDVIRCNEFGIWDKLFGTCHVIDCGWPEDVPNDVPLSIISGIAGGFSYNATACIKSNEGFTKFQDMYESLRCSGEGYWKGNLRECFEITKKESCMDQDGKKMILPIAVLVPICLILIATHIATFLKYRRYAGYQGHPSEQIEVDITIADQFGSSQNEITKREQTRLSHTNGDIELQRRKRRSEETHSQGTEQYDELQIDHRQIPEYDELQFKRDLTSNKGTMSEDTDEFAQI